MKILVVNGPNLNLLGSREPAVYGREDYSALVASIAEWAGEHGALADVRQFNGEGDIVDAIQAADGAYDALVVNPGAYTHYSYAIHDALKAISVPAVEVHISNIAAREQFRRLSVTAPACVGQIGGLGFYGYKAAIDYFMERAR